MSELKDFLKDDTDNKMPSELSFAEMLQQSTSNANIAANSGNTYLLLIHVNNIYVHISI